MRVIRFFPEWGRTEPLWEEGAEEPAIYAADLGLSQEMTDKLRAYEKFWTEHFDELKGYDSPANQEKSEKEARALMAELQELLGDGYVVRDELYS